MIPDDDECKGYRNYCDCPECAETEDQAYIEETEVQP